MYGVAMTSTLGNLLIGALFTCVGLYILWQIVERLDHFFIRRRRAKIRKEAGGDSICKWGFNSKGELGHVRCKRTTEN